MTAYATLAQIKSALADGFDPLNTVFDTVLSEIAERVSVYIDAYCERTFQLTNGTKYYCGDNQQTIWIDALIAVTAVEYSFDAGTTWTPLLPAEYKLTNAGNQNTLSSWTTIELTGIASIGVFSDIRITGDWGEVQNRALPAVHPLVVQACIVETVRLFKRGQSAFQSWSGANDIGQTILERGIDEATKQLLAPVRRGGYS